MNIPVRRWVALFGLAAVMWFVVVAVAVRLLSLAGAIQ